MVKLCGKCNKEKELIEFKDDIRYTGCKFPYCKECQKLISKVSYEKRKEKSKIIVRKKKEKKDTIDKCKKCRHIRVSSAIFPSKNGKQSSIICQYYNKFLCFSKENTKLDLSFCKNKAI